MTVIPHIVGGAAMQGGQFKPYVQDEGDAGPQGNSGWSPVLAGVADGVRTLIQIIDWTGGAGDKPASGMYIGANGYVSAKADAFNFNAAKRFAIFSGVTDASGVATVAFGFSPALTNPPSIAFWGNPPVLTGPIKVDEVANSRTATQVKLKVTQAALVTGVLTALVGATVFVLAIET